MNKRTNFGFSSILISFVMICIITFCALALVTANSDYKLSQKVATRNGQYYEMEMMAYETLSQIDYSLESSYILASSKESYYQSVHSALSDIDGSWDDTTQTPRFTYKAAISDTLYLEVSLEILYPDNSSQGYYEIAGWHTVQLQDAFVEQPLNLMGADHE